MAAAQRDQSFITFKATILLGRDPSAVVGRMKRGGSIPAPRRNLPAGIPAQVLVNRPDIRSAERQLAQATA
ncbi:hypothetical protein J8J27_29470, partial [Mycobacterium tuberculosis]|nr:hypothetical protein [Mycobacterium tuberculosis]